MELIPQNMYILNSSFGFVGTLTKFQSLDVWWRFAKLGEFTMTLDKNNFAVDYIDENTFIWLSAERVLWVKYIQKVEGENSDYYSIKGYTAKDLPRCRVTDPQMFPASVSGTDGYYKYTSQYPDYIVYDLIDKFLINGPTGYTAFTAPGVSVGVSASIGSQVDFTTRLKNVFSDISSLLISQNLGLIASVDIADETCTFEVRDGSDLSGSQKFGISNGRLISADHMRDWRSSYNYLIGGGDGEGLSRTFRNTAVPDTGINIDVGFVDMRDLSTTSEMDDRLSEKLIEYAPIDSNSVEVNIGQGQIYEDYKLGDYIYLLNTSERKQITGIHESYQQSEPIKIEAELGYSASDITSALERIYSNISNEITI